MATNNINQESFPHKNEKILDLWGKRSPKFEKKYEQSVMRQLADYGIGASENTNAKGKILGAGYEPYIMAFFIGLYSGKKLPLSDDSDDVKTLGQPLQYWGNLDSKKLRRAYPMLRTYMFIALVAKTDVDWIALDKGEIQVQSVVSDLIQTMEEYANYGFSVMEEKLKQDQSYFYSNRSFLDLFFQLTDKEEIIVEDTDTPEEI